MAARARAVGGPLEDGGPSRRPPRRRWRQRSRGWAPRGDRRPTPAVPLVRRSSGSDAKARGSGWGAGGAEPRPRTRPARPPPAPAAATRLVGRRSDRSARPATPPTAAAKATPWARLGAPALTLGESRTAWDAVCAGNQLPTTAVWSHRRRDSSSGPGAAPLSFERYRAIPNEHHRPFALPKQVSFG